MEEGGLDLSRWSLKNPWKFSNLFLYSVISTLTCTDLASYINSGF